MQEVKKEEKSAEKKKAKKVVETKQPKPDLTKSMQKMTIEELHTVISADNMKKPKKLEKK